MKPIPSLTRIGVLFLALTFAVGHSPAYALRVPETGEATGLEELTKALRRPDKALERLAQLATAPPAISPAAGLEEVSRITEETDFSTLKVGGFLVSTDGTEYEIQAVNRDPDRVLTKLPGSRQVERFFKEEIIRWYYSYRPPPAAGLEEVSNLFIYADDRSAAIFSAHMTDDWVMSRRSKGRLDQRVIADWDYRSGLSFFSPARYDAAVLVITKDESPALSFIQAVNPPGAATPFPIVVYARVNTHSVVAALKDLKDKGQILGYAERLDQIIKVLNLLDEAVKPSARPVPGSPAAGLEEKEKIKLAPALRVPRPPEKDTWLSVTEGRKLLAFLLAQQAKPTGAAVGTIYYTGTHQTAKAAGLALAVPSTPIEVQIESDAVQARLHPEAKWTFLRDGEENFYRVRENSSDIIFYDVESAHPADRRDFMATKDFAVQGRAESLLSAGLEERSLDGLYTAQVAGETGTAIQVFQRGSLIHTFRTPREIMGRGIRFDPEGRPKLAVLIESDSQVLDPLDDNVLFIWDVGSGDLLEKLPWDQNNPKFKAQYNRFFGAGLEEGIDPEAALLSEDEELAKARQGASEKPVSVPSISADRIEPIEHIPGVPLRLPSRANRTGLEERAAVVQEAPAPTAGRSRLTSVAVENHVLILGPGAIGVLTAASHLVPTDASAIPIVVVAENARQADQVKAWALDLPLLSVEVIDASLPTYGGDVEKALQMTIRYYAGEKGMSPIVARTLADLPEVARLLGVPEPEAFVREAELQAQQDLARHNL